METTSVWYWIFLVFCGLTGYMAAELGRALRWSFKKSAALGFILIMLAWAAAHAA